MLAAIFMFSPVARRGPPAKITAPCHKMGVQECMEGTRELFLFSNAKNEAILISRMKPKEKRQQNYGAMNSMAST